MIYLEKHIVKDLIVYKIDKLVDEDILIDLIKNGVLCIIDSNKTDLELPENTPIIAIIKKYLIDNGDYNYDDIYEPNYEEEESYFPIEYNPINGKKFEIIISKTIDDTTRYLEVLDEIEKMKKKSLNVKKNYQYYNSLMQEFYSLTNSNYFI